MTRFHETSCMSLNNMYRLAGIQGALMNVMYRFLACQGCTGSTYMEMFVYRADNVCAHLKTDFCPQCPLD